MRGYTLTNEEMLVRDVINSIMCNGWANLDQMAKRHNMSIDAVTGLLNFNMEQFAEMQADGLLQATATEIELTATGKQFARNVAMKLDPYLKTGEKMYSKTV